MENGVPEILVALFAVAVGVQSAIFRLPIHPLPQAPVTLPLFQTDANANWKHSEQSKPWNNLSLWVCHLD